jgi:hypothetical protein
MPNKTTKAKRTRIPSPRYSIAEWYGRSIAELTPEERLAFGKLAKKQVRAPKGTAVNSPPCPFLSVLIPDAPCNKRGGVCSIRKYTHGTDGCTFDPNDKIVTTCPLRFIQDVENGESIFSWIGQKMVDTTSPIVVKETPFLRKVSTDRLPVEAMTDVNAATGIRDEQEEEKKAGRIDWIVVKPESLSQPELEWAAVETQAVYFSGDKMMVEFEAYAAVPSPLLFPLGQRRPDYRSNGPKRLSPQLDVKVPVLGAWGKKVAVLVDRYFFDNMTRLDEVFTRGDDRARRDNAAIVWFIVDYDEKLHLRKDGIHYTTLASSRKALNATEPLEKADFTSNLIGVIKNPQRTNKIFNPLVIEVHE